MFIFITVIFTYRIASYSVRRIELSLIRLFIVIITLVLLSLIVNNNSRVRSMTSNNIYISFNANEVVFSQQTKASCIVQKSVVKCNFDGQEKARPAVAISTIEKICFLNAHINCLNVASICLLNLSKLLIVCIFLHDVEILVSNE